MAWYDPVRPQNDPRKDMARMAAVRSAKAMQAYRLPAQGSPDTEVSRLMGIRREQAHRHINSAMQLPVTASWLRDQLVNEVRGFVGVFNV